MNWMKSREYQFFISSYATKYIDKYPLFIIFITAILSTLIVYIPFWVDGSFDILYRYWDGPNYAYLAESLYFIPKDHPLSAYTTPEYFSAHLPVYPLSISLFSFFGYLNAMLITTILYSGLAAIVLYKLLRETQTVESPFWSAIISLFIPARYLIYHSVGATEAPFIFFTLWSMLAYIRGQYILCFALAGLSGITRITGILIGGAYFMMLITDGKWKKIPLLALIGFPLLATFTFYHFHYGDFFAYFGTNYSSSNKLISLKPFDLLLTYSGNGNTHSAEFYLMMYAIYGLGTALLWSKNKLFFWYCFFTFFFSIFIVHQDVSRYLIPMAPLALVAAYDSVFSKNAFKFLFFPFLVLVYIYTWGMLPKNVIDVKNFNKLERYLEKDVDTPIVYETFGDLSMTSCGYDSCRSHIAAGRGLRLFPERGLSIYGHYENGQLIYMGNIDHCANKKAYVDSPTLKELIDQQDTKPKSVFLLSDDTVVCDYNKLSGIDDWVKGFDLRKLKSIKFRQTYVGIIDVDSGKTSELRDKKTIKYP